MLGLHPFRFCFCTHPPLTLSPQSQLEAIWPLRETEQDRRAPGKPAAGQPAGPWFTKTRPSLPGPPFQAPCHWDLLISCLARAPDRWPFRLKFLGLGRNVETV